MTNDPRPELIEILRELNPSAATDAVHRYAEWLYMASVFGSFGDLPRARNAGSAKAGRALARAAAKAAGLAKDLCELPSDALWTFETIESPGELHPVLLMKTLRAFAESARQAAVTMPPSPPYRGNRQRVQPQQVARMACKIFKLLTGEAGGRIHDPYGNKRTYGPLHDFLAQAFRALHIEASADGVLKTVLATPRILRK